MTPITTIVRAALVLCLLAPGLARAEDAKPVEGPPSGDKAPWPHVRVDREAGVVEFDAKVVLDDAEWLELIVCTTGGREYEAIAATDARPSHIHLALMTVGLEPGNPSAWQRNDKDDLVQIKPTGPQVAVTIHWEQDGKKHETSANRWIKDAKSGEAMPGEAWLFTGSQLVEHNGERIYMADANGTVISLVNFGDDLMSRDTDLTNQTDEGQWVANGEAIPPAGTAITVRLTPVKPKP